MGVLALEMGVLASETDVFALEMGVVSLDKGGLALEKGVLALEKGVLALESGVRGPAPTRHRARGDRVHAALESDHAGDLLRLPRLDRLGRQHARQSTPTLLYPLFSTSP